MGTRSPALRLWDPATGRVPDTFRELPGQSQRRLGVVSTPSSLALLRAQPPSGRKPPMAEPRARPSVSKPTQGSLGLTRASPSARLGWYDTVVAGAPPGSRPYGRKPRWLSRERSERVEANARICWDSPQASPSATLGVVSTPSSLALLRAQPPIPTQAPVAEPRAPASVSKPTQPRAGTARDSASATLGWFRHRRRWRSCGLSHR